MTCFDNLSVSVCLVDSKRRWRKIAPAKVTTTRKTPSVELRAKIKTCLDFSEAGKGAEVIKDGVTLLLSNRETLGIKCFFFPSLSVSRKQRW